MSKPKSILLADDQPEEIKELASKLESAGYEVAAVSNGNELISALRVKKPDMIITDLMMPYKDGFEAIEEIKVDPELSGIPIIVSSLFEQKDYAERLTKLGIKDYFVKTQLSADEVVRRVGEILL